MDTTRQRLDDSGAPEGNIRDVQAAPKVAVKMAAGQDESESEQVDDLPFDDDWTEPFGGPTVMFESLNRLEFIAVESPLPLKVCQLQCSARIFYAGMEVLLHNCGSLMLLDDSFVARVRLVDMGPLQQATTFSEAASALYSITEILVDNMKAQRDQHRSELLTTFNRIRQRTSSDNVCAADARQIFSVVQSSSNLDYVELCEQLCSNASISRGLRDQVEKLLQIEQEVGQRNAFLAKFHAKFTNSTHELGTALQEFHEAVVASRVKSLLDMAPHFLGRHLKDIPERTVFQIHDNDVKLFHDLDKVLNKKIFAKPLGDLAKRWTAQMKSLKQGEQLVSAINPIYLSLCRSLEELIVEIVDRTDHKPEELLLSDDGGWFPIKSAIIWKTVTGYTKCLQHEYSFIFRLLKHYHPVTGSKKPLEYQTRRLQQQNPLGIAEELYVWFCLLDDVLHHALPQASLATFERILQDFVQLVRDASLEQMDTIRVITRNTARFIVQTFPFVDAVQSDEDKELLQAQWGEINRTESACTFRDRVDVFSGYWQNRWEMIQRIPSENGLPDAATRRRCRKRADFIRKRQLALKPKPPAELPSQPSVIPKPPKALPPQPNAISKPPAKYPPQPSASTQHARRADSREAGATKEKAELYTTAELFDIFTEYWTRWKNCKTRSEQAFVVAYMNFKYGR
ncbi:hypothetical protein pipiens_007376 [Culex pipiens pipiens]|uniref:Uncharacterized protein n=1 Tax=Culex pipiens pipiens TaxID=38569 RepID=A0ABD1DL83_CULPP